METTSFENILTDVADLVTTLDPANLDAAEFRGIRRLANRRLSWCWEFHFWPELMRVEQRWFRPIYSSAETYAAGDQVFFPADQNYYQAITDTTGNDPATLSGSEYVTNDAYWTLAEASYSGDDYDSAEVADYAAPDVVRYPVDGKYYQRNALDAVNIAGAGYSAVNAIVERTGDSNGKPEYGTAEGVRVNWTGSLWVISAYEDGLTTLAYTSFEDVATPDLVETWTTSYSPSPTVTMSGPPGTAFWAELIPFVRYVAYEQDGYTALGSVVAVYESNPHITTRAKAAKWMLTNDGVLVRSAVGSVWVEYRLRCPVLSGDAYDATATYAAGQQVYFADDSTAGNFYTALSATTAGQSPATHPALWQVVELPRAFHKPMVHAIAADWIRGPGGGEPNDAAVELAVAISALEDQKSLLVGQQGQRLKTQIQTR